MTYIDGLIEFVTESNRIEGIGRPATDGELAAHRQFLSDESVRSGMLAAFVHKIGGGPLRVGQGMNVRVGNHFPPLGGPAIADRLESLLRKVNANEIDPWLAHVEYETLHPFMDGNGRSGRAIWAWQILRHNHYPRTLNMGFLHPAYYAALSHSRAAT